ncbi:MAG: glycosyl hydrolase 115 family protein, partial [bacterium]|nr:glycosyl hydrolase 115 family protein [bacterium]
MAAVITYNTKIQTEVHTKAIEKAIANLVRDIKKACCNTNAPGAMISLVKGEQERECFHLGITSQGVTIEAKDELGFIYGIYEISKRILGIQPFWFWNDQVIEPKESYTVEEEYQSSPYPIRFRGWFINDEVLIQNWTINGKKEIAWEMAFEALLRCGGNMIIPGTDRNAELHKDLAV